MKTLWIRIIFFLVALFLFGACRGVPQSEAKVITKVVTVIDTIDVAIYDTVQVVNTLDSLVIDTLHTILHDTNVVERVVRVVESGIKTNLSLDTSLTFDNRIIRLQVHVKDNKIALNLRSNGLTTNEIETAEGGGTLLNDWYVWLGVGFILGVVFLLVFRAFSKWAFGFK